LTAPQDQAADLDAEILLSELEGSLRPELDERLRAAYRAHIEGGAGMPRWPARLFDEALSSRVHKVLARLPPGGVPSRRLRVVRHIIVSARVLSAGGFAERNRAARALGALDFYQLHLDIEELHLDEIEERLGPVHPPHRTAGDEALVQALARVDADEVYRRAVELLNEGGVTIAPTRRGSGATGRSRAFVIAPDDVRLVLAPITGAAGWRALWHELGHAFAAASVGDDLPWPLVRVASRTLDEAVAERFALLGERADVLARVLAMSEDHAARVSDDLRWRRQRWRSWQRARAAFERAAYLTDGVDPTRLDSMWARLVAEHTGERVGPESWRELHHLDDDPGAQALYLIAEDVAVELARVSLERLGNSLAPGASVSWRQIVGTLARGGSPGHHSSEP
jgi:hypothetical protein